MSHTIDLAKNPKYCLRGQIVTVDANGTVLEDGVIYIEKNMIADIRPASSPPPAGFEGVLVIKTNGTVFPGLIELHNHLSYNVLPLWNVPQKFQNRGKWQNLPEKQKLVTGPMHVLGRTMDYLEAIVRYVECKCLVAGVTTSQGITLCNSRIEQCYRGVVRNVERAENDFLPDAGTRVADVQSPAKFLEDLKKYKCKLLHLSEGTDEKSREHFKALKISEDQWAINDALAGIHCVALTEEDFKVMKKFNGSVIWSPMSNLLLYNETARIQSAKEAGLLIGIGSDWSVSGSKNLLCELKVAKLYSLNNGSFLTDQDLVKMATINAAKILKWDKLLGSLESGKLADIIVIKGKGEHPYTRLVEASEASVTHVIIDGLPRCGLKSFMKVFGYKEEEVKIGGGKRVLNLAESYDNPIKVGVTLEEARDKLQDALNNLETLAKEAKKIDGDIAAAAADDSLEPIWFLSLEQDELKDTSIRPHLRLEGDVTGFPVLLEAVDYEKVLTGVHILLDPLTVVDDDGYFSNLSNQMNLPSYVKIELPKLYGVKKVLPDGAKFLRNVPSREVREQFADTVELSQFLEWTSSNRVLSSEDRRLIIDQALTLLESVYVHLPFKRAMHAIDPIQRLRLLQYQYEKGIDINTPDIDFHREMTRIFTSTRDLHTNYLLPYPFRDKVVFLPFLIEEYYEGDTPRYIVSKIFKGFGKKGFGEGTEVLYWNGIPIRRAIEINAENQGGSNPDARFVRGLDALTIRPMIRVLPPDEEWVTIDYKTDGKVTKLEQAWLVASLPDLESLIPDSRVGGDDGSSLSLSSAIGVDTQTDAIQQMKKILFAPTAWVLEKAIKEKSLGRGVASPGKGFMETSMPHVLKVMPITYEGVEYGYIRIYTFQVEDDQAFLDEFVRLVKELPKNGFIIDIRGNGGGLIYAAERLLQIFSKSSVEPEAAQFINTRVTYDLCRRNSPSPLSQNFSLAAWTDSIGEAVRTGATFSLSFPITPREKCNDVNWKYVGPVLLITDAMCYSATDMFAAGFKDHGIGKILGIHQFTGAGGANVWTHSLIQELMSSPASDGNLPSSNPFKPLPHGTEMRVAVRRTLRVGEYAGMPVEDYGVKRDLPHKMTKDDVLEGNRDLIKEACKQLSQIARERS